MWLTGRLMPDFKTIANFRKDNSKAIRGVCRQFFVLCQQLGLFGEHLVAIDGRKFKAVNNRDLNFTRANCRLQRANSGRHPEHKQFRISYSLLANKAAVDKALKQVSEIQDGRETEVRQTPLVDLTKE